MIRSRSRLSLRASASIRVCSQTRVSCFAVFAGLDAELMLAERLAAHRHRGDRSTTLRRHLRLKQQRLRLLAQRAGVALPLLDSRALVALFLELVSSAFSAATTSRKPLAELP
jgi:hypothetical protein